jgi:tetratricopeptide (TPR) repeat protein
MNWLSIIIDLFVGSLSEGAGAPAFSHHSPDDAGNPDKVYREYLHKSNDLLDQDPNNVQALVMRGMAHHGKGRNQEALKDLDRALKLKPDNARALILRSEVHFSLGHYDQAREDRKQAVRLDPSVG